MRDSRIVPVDTLRRAIGVLQEGRGPNDPILHKLVEDHERYTALVSLHERTGGRSEELDVVIRETGLDLAIQLLNVVTHP